MKKVKKVFVFLDFGNTRLKVGTLVEDKKHVYFQFEASFLQEKYEISPFKLKKTNEILSCPNSPFDGLFGVFNDSLPDGWGRLLMDRKLLNKGLNPSYISTLDRLSIIGRHGQGALVYEPENNENQKEIEINLDVFAKESLEILKNGKYDLLDELFQMGGNSVGARPKILVHYDSKEHDLSVISNAKSEPWIIKFPALYDIIDSAKIEFAYYQMAKNCGIEISESKLFSSKNGMVYFGTKRFDRDHANRIHYHSLSGLLHDNFRVSSLDYGHVMDAANRLENNLLAAEKVFRIACFNVFSCNMDDHSKNISFLMDVKGNWKLAPAFDLTYSPSKESFQSLSVGGVQQNVSKKNLLSLASHFNIQKADKIIDEVQTSLSNWKSIASEFDIDSKITQQIQKSIDLALKRK
jgi:serine/threonine-protein kinase HipA